MPAGENAVKGQQGFQTTQRPPADIDGVEVGAQSPALSAYEQASRRFQDARSELSAAAEAYLASEVRAEHPDAVSFTISSDWTDEGRQRIFFMHATDADGDEHDMTDMDAAEDILAEDHVWHGDMAVIDLPPAVPPATEAAPDPVLAAMSEQQREIHDRSRPTIEADLAGAGFSVIAVKRRRFGGRAEVVVQGANGARATYETNADPGYSPFGLEHEPEWKLDGRRDKATPADVRRALGGTG